MEMAAKNRRAGRLAVIMLSFALIIQIFGAKGSITAYATPESAGVSEEKGNNTAAEVDAVMEKMTLREKVGQMLIPAFRTWNDYPDHKDEGAVPFTRMNETVRETIAKSRLGA